MTTNVLPLNDATDRLVAAHKAGDPAALKAAAIDFVRSKRRFERQRGLSTKKVDVNEGIGKGQQLLEGVGGGLENVRLRGMRMLTPESLEGDLSKRIEDNDRANAQMSGIQQVGKFGGEMLATAPLGGAVGGGIRGLAAAGSTAKKANVLARALSYGAEGAVGGNLVEEDGAALGAGINLAATPALNRVGRLLKAAGRGMKMDDAAATALQYGADPTPGQMAPHSWMGRIERTAATSPIMGAGIAEARQNALKPVVPSLAADQAGIRRVAGESLEDVSTRIRQRKDRLYKGVESTPLAPEDVAGIARDKTARITAGREARRTVRGEFTREMQDAVGASERARARVIRAEDRLAKNRNPEIEEALRIELNQARRTHQVRERATRELLGQRVPREMQASKTARGLQTPEMLRGLERRAEQAMRAVGLKSDHPVFKEIMEQGRGIVRVPSAQAAQKARSNLRALKGDYKYGRNNRAKDRQAAEAIEDAIKWFDETFESALQHRSPFLQARVKAGDTVTAKTAPVLDAIDSALVRKNQEVSGVDLFRGLRKSLPKGSYREGAGGEVRRVGKALNELQKSHGAGFIERLPLLRAALGAVAVPSAAIAASKPVRRVLQGQMGYQKTVRELGKTKSGRMLLRTIEGARPGLAPAMIPDHEQTED